GNDLERPSVLDIRESGTPLPVSDHQAGVSKDSLLSVRFSEPMDYQSAQTAVWLSKAADGAGVAALLFWNPLFTELTIHPSEPLEPLTDYRLTVSTAAKDLAGNSLSAPYNLVFRVDDTRGAGNSRYLSPLSVSKTLPTPVEDFLPLDSVTTYRTTSATGSVVLELVFSHALEPGSVADNISISKILGTSPGYGNITAIQFADAPNANQKVILTVGNLGLSNEYELRMNGGRSGIKSARLLSESGTWLEKDQSVFFRVFR
ncbi:MAG: Ig-like domain-containing protein, partial [Spirochaetia bacterium]|nr:Ig-like domain-containing protein [Spirochaetia bacterium]